MAWIKIWNEIKIKKRQFLRRSVKTVEGRKHNIKDKLI